MKLNSYEYHHIKRNILKKLYAYGAFTKGHLLFERLLHGVPSHLSGFVKDVLDDLLKEEWVLLCTETENSDL